MTKLRVLIVSMLLALGAFVPLVAALAPSQPSHPSVVRIADQPTPTPTRDWGNPPGGCGSGGC